jgi:hypothetical protein
LRGISTFGRVLDIVWGKVRGTTRTSISIK